MNWNSRDSDILWVQPGGDWFDRNKVSQGNASYATITLKISSLPYSRYYELDVNDLVKEYVSWGMKAGAFWSRHSLKRRRYGSYSSDTENEEQYPKTEHKTGLKDFTSGEFYQLESVKKLTRAHTKIPEFFWYTLEIRRFDLDQILLILTRNRIFV